MLFRSRRSAVSVKLSVVTALPDSCCAELDEQPESHIPQKSGGFVGTGVGVFVGTGVNVGVLVGTKVDVGIIGVLVGGGVPSNVYAAINFADEYFRSQRDRSNAITRRMPVESLFLMMKESEFPCCHDPFTTVCTSLETLGGERLIPRLHVRVSISSFGSASLILHSTGSFVSRRVLLPGGFVEVKVAGDPVVSASIFNSKGTVYVPSTVKMI